MAELVLTLSPDGTALLVDVTDGGNMLASAQYDALDLSTLIERLGGLRAQMAEPVTEMLDHGARMSAVPDPEWATNPGQEQFQGRVWLSIRHPGFGWQSFLLREDQASRLGTSLCRGGQ